MRRPRPQEGRGVGGLTETAGESEGNVAGDNPRGAVATADATSKDTAASGAGGCHGEERGKRTRVAGRQENPSGESSGVVNREGGH